MSTSYYRIAYALGEFWKKMPILLQITIELFVVACAIPTVFLWAVGLALFGLAREREIVVGIALLSFFGAVLGFIVHAQLLERSGLFLLVTSSLFILHLRNDRLRENYRTAAH